VRGWNEALTHFRYGAKNFDIILLSVFDQLHLENLGEDFGTQDMFILRRHSL
jgi:hypothetical protein